MVRRSPSGLDWLCSSVSLFAPSDPNKRSVPVDSGGRRADLFSGGPLSCAVQRGVLAADHGMGFLYPALAGICDIADRADTGRRCGVTLVPAEMGTADRLWMYSGGRASDPFLQCVMRDLLRKRGLEGTYAHGGRSGQNAMEP